VQYAGLEAMRGSMDSVAVMLAEYNRRREHIVAGLRAIPGVTCNMPQGAFYVFPNVSAHLHASMPDDGAVAKALLEKEHVAVTPGGAFGAPGHLRLSYATSMDRIDEGLKRLKRFFAGQA
jgi:aspartate aminotransferase